MIEIALQRYALLALLAAALFGVSTPLAKLLLGTFSPLLLAGLLYLGSGCGLLLLTLIRKYTYSKNVAVPREAPLARHDFLWLGGAVLTGGVIAPILLFWGLSVTAAATASLLLNLESVLTALLGAWVFREAVGRRLWLALGIMLAAGLLLSYQPDVSVQISPGSLAIAGACLLWGLDNNLTRKISAGDPISIAMIKGLVAGAANICLFVASGGVMTAGGWALAGALLLGFASFGISLVLFIYALRHLGSARTGAHFSTAPFIGAATAILLLNEPFDVTFVIALALMLIATWLVLTEQHLHEHSHEYMVHTHRHVHDIHHQHAHRGEEGPEPHVHEHEHRPLVHSHPHLPDLHHRHEH
jgi:drug/metabolite transporter (DMT)-like permease